MHARWLVSVVAISGSVALVGTAVAKPYTPPPPPPPPPPLVTPPPPARLSWHPPEPTRAPAPNAADQRGFTMSVDLGVNELNFRDAGGAGVIGETLSTELAIGVWIHPRV